MVVDEPSEGGSAAGWGHMKPKKAPEKAPVRQAERRWEPGILHGLGGSWAAAINSKLFESRSPALRSLGVSFQVQGGQMLLHTKGDAGPNWYWR